MGSAAVTFVSVPGVPCPQCGATGRALVGLGLGRPEPGDLVICVLCGEVAIFTVAMTLRAFTADDLAYYRPMDLARVAQAVSDLRTAYDRRN
jgi:hypothetical protein